MLLKLDEYVARSGLKKNTLLQLLRSGKAPGKKIGGEWLVLEKDVEPWVEKYMKEK